MAGNVLEVSEQSWGTEVINAGKPVLVDFWAAWCGPCRMVAPVIEELASEYADKIKVVKLNVDDNQAISTQYQVMSIPTFAVFQNGALKKRFVGAMPKEGFVKELAEWL
ncbi:MAG TPA: thioredoxin [Candidatus Aquicultor sp.]|jgi:thioredoxin 1